MTEEKVILTVETKDSQQSLADLRKELKSAKDAMIAAEEGTEEYNAALKIAAERTHQLSEINRVIKGTAMDFGAVLKNTTAVLSGVAGGMNALRGVSALLGTDNVALQETFVKLQAGMAIVQGLQGIDGMVKGFQNLGTVLKSSSVGIKAITIVQNLWNKAVAANPIMILVGALALLGGAIAGVTSYMKSSNDEQREANRLQREAEALAATRRMNALMNNLEFEKELELKRIAGATEQELNNDRIKMINDELARNRSRVTQLINLETSLQKKGKELSAKAKEELNTKIKDIENFEIEKRKLTNANEVLDARDRKKTVDDEKAKLDEILRLEKESYAKRLQEQIIFNENLSTKLISDQESRKALLDKWRSDDDKFAEEMFDKQETELDLFISQADAENKIFFEQQKEAFDNQQKLRVLDLQRRQQAADAAAGIMMSLADIVGRDSELGKAMAVASTTISTYNSAQLAYQSAFLPVPTAASPVLGGLAAGAAIAAGIANVKSILSVKIPRKGATGTPSIRGNSVQAPKPPSFLPKIESVKNVNTDSEVQLQGAPIKAYVVESEITNTQKKMRGVEYESSF